MFWAFVDRYDDMAYFGGNFNFLQTPNLEGNFMDRLLCRFILLYHTRLFVFPSHLLLPKNMYVGVFWSNKAFVFTFAMEISCDESVRVKPSTVSGTFTELYG